MENLKKYFILSDTYEDAYSKLEDVSFETLIVINKNKFLGTLMTVIFGEEYLMALILIVK